LKSRRFLSFMVIGTSIGAINASLIAGNKPEDRLQRLNDFWRRVENAPTLEAMSNLPFFGQMLPNWMMLASGIAGFYKPNPLAHLGLNVSLAAEAAGYYSTRPLASGALPPAFPAVRINGTLYWDGGILSNTPVEAVFNDIPRRNSLVFAVHLWNPEGREPETMRQVMNRQKDLQYSSRAVSHIQRQKQIHRLRHIIADLAARLPEAERVKPEVKTMAAYGCLTTMHVVRLLAPKLMGEDHTKDIDFSASGIRMRREAGYADTQRALRQRLWEGEFDQLEGFILHEIQGTADVTPG
jgi:NTE family protein